MPVILPPAWRLPASAITPESAWLNRRTFLTGAGAAALSIGCTPADAADRWAPAMYAYALPEFSRNPRWAGGVAPAERITAEEFASTYNNFYEFTAAKGEVWKLARDMPVKPWTVKVHGLCDKPRTFDVDDLLKAMPIEERVYRFRCVEAWSMVVPWVGFELRKLLEVVQPSNKARYVRLVTLNEPRRFPGVRNQTWYPWPYFEGVSMAEATCELTLLAVGIYGHPLPGQHGAPIRLITPWKYGYKSIKSVVEIELVSRKPKTFWNQMAPAEYDFDGNVRPDIGHPRWSQATDRVIPSGERVPTPMYNGYADLVAGLYDR